MRTFKYNVIKPILEVRCVRAVHFKASQNRSCSITEISRNGNPFFSLSMSNCQTPKIGSCIQFSNSVLFWGQPFRNYHIWPRSIFIWIKRWQNVGFLTIWHKETFKVSNLSFNLALSKTYIFLICRLDKLTKSWRKIYANSEFRIWFFVF